MATTMMVAGSSKGLLDSEAVEVVPVRIRDPVGNRVNGCRVGEAVVGLESEGGESE